MASSSKQSGTGDLSEASSDVEGLDDPEADGGEAASPNWAEVDEDVGLDESTADADIDPESVQEHLDDEDDDATPDADDEQKGGGRVGETLAGRYDLVEFIERGAMGEVYRAEHALMKKKVAIKILHSEVTGQGKIVERFRREAQAAANIDHPNVCIATDFGRTDAGEFFLVMEYLRGETLKEVVDRQGRFEVDRALHVAHQIASALARAHQVGVIHRDLKPDNIMLVERGDDSDFVKILDFGIARVRMEDQTPELTKTGAVFGTPSYMSPEQAAGDPLDHRADLYALGNVMFEMVTGRRVFEADRGAQVMAMHVSKDPPRPSELIDSEIDPEVESLILSLLDKEPDARPQSAIRLRARLEELGAGEGLFPHPEAEAGDSSEQGAVAETREPAPARLDDEDASQVLTRVLDGLSGWFKRQGRAARWAAIGLLGIGGLMAGSLLVVVTSENGAGAAGEEAAIGEEASVIDRRRQFLAGPTLEDVEQAFTNGAYGTTLREIEEVREETDLDSPHLDFLEGRAHAERGEWEQSVESFERLLERDPAYLQDRGLVQGLIGALGAVDGEVAGRAEALLAPRLDRESILTTLGRSAWRGGGSRTRRRAYELLQREGVFGELPDWVRASIELRHAHGCDQHRERIDRLVELGDPRGLEILHMYDNFPTRGCGELDEKDCFGCIRGDIREAIEQLRRKLEDPPSAAPATSPPRDDTGTAVE